MRERQQPLTWSHSCPGLMPQHWWQEFLLDKKHIAWRDRVLTFLVRLDQSGNILLYGLPLGCSRCLQPQEMLTVRESGLDCRCAKCWVGWIGLDIIKSQQAELGVTDAITAIAPIFERGCKSFSCNQQQLINLILSCLSEIFGSMCNVMDHDSYRRV